MAHTKPLSSFTCPVPTVLEDLIVMLYPHGDCRLEFVTLLGTFSDDGMFSPACPPFHSIYPPT
jgi:hypothetical protein